MKMTMKDEVHKHRLFITCHQKGKMYISVSVMKLLGVETGDTVDIGMDNENLTVMKGMNYAIGTTHCIHLGTNIRNIGLDQGRYSFKSWDPDIQMITFEPGYDYET